MQNYWYMFKDRNRVSISVSLGGCADALIMYTQPQVGYLHPNRTVISHQLHQAAVEI